MVSQHYRVFALVAVAALYTIPITGIFTFRSNELPLNNLWGRAVCRRMSKHATRRQRSWAELEWHYHLGVMSLISLAISEATTDAELAKEKGIRPWFQVATAWTLCSVSVYLHQYRTYTRASDTAKDWMAAIGSVLFVRSAYEETRQAAQQSTNAAVHFTLACVAVAMAILSARHTDTARRMCERQEAGNKSKVKLLEAKTYKEIASNKFKSIDNTIKAASRAVKNK